MNDDNNNKQYDLVYFEIVGFCNAKCPWCITGNNSLDKSKYPSKYIDVSDFENAVNYLLDNNFITPGKSRIDLYSWGEPLLHPDLNGILRILSKNNIDFGISTNASKIVQLDKENLKNLVEFKFSMPGFSQLSYDRIHGFSFNEILNNIRTLTNDIYRKNSSVYFAMSYHLYQFNISEIKPVIRFCKDNGIDFKPYTAYFNDFDLAKAHLDGSISREMLEKASKELFLYYVDELIDNKPHDYVCQQHNILTIDENCNVLTCCVLPKDHPEYSIGNLFKLSCDETRERKLSQTICTECNKLGIAYWMNNALVPDYVGTIEKDYKVLIEYENITQDFENQILTLENQIEASENQISSLESHIRTIDESIIIQSLKKYQKFIEKILRTGTRRRNFYELILTGIRTIINEGWGSFLKKVKYWLRIRKTIPQKSKLVLPKFQHNISTKDVSKILFPIPSQKPEVSIIIPVYNKWKYTYNCLKSISENTEGDYEVIVIDDASSDQTTEVFSKVNNLRLVRNKQNAGFVESCNRGARESKGRYILFLNNDTMVTENWLMPLIEVITREDVGAVGSMLVYSNGTLQEAGSIVWNDGSALGYGRGDDPEKPEYNYIREVDYCSGACLLVKRDLFEKTGGFDERFKPGYYEDTDLCMSIRNCGYKVMYQPKSVIVHFEGITGGTSISSGTKKYQDLNQPKFVEKWNTVLKKHHYSPTIENILLARDRNSGKRILVLDDRIPTPSQGAGYPRAHSMLRYIQEFGYRVTFFPLDNTIPWQPCTDEFQQSGIEMFYGDDLNFTKFTEDRINYYDMILVSRPHNMKKTYYIIKKYFPTAFLLYDAEAMFSIREMLKAKVRGTKLEEQSAERMMNEEISLINKVDSIITVSEVEKQLILEKTHVNSVNVWGHSIEIKEPKTPYTERNDILFVGGFLAIDSPNEDAILYFTREIFPDIEETLRCRLIIAGMNPPDAVKKLSSSSIIVTGYVEDLTEYYEKCRVFIVPHRYSAGIPWKLQEAMSYGIPSVISELTRQQLNLTDSKEVMVADNIEEFKQKVMRLYREEELWNRIQKNALQYIQEVCNPDILKARLQDIIERGLRNQAKIK